MAAPISGAKAAIVSGNLSTEATAASTVDLTYGSRRVMPGIRSKWVS
jgi:hypothetical protein